MELHSLTSTTGARKKRKRVGRGPSSGHGKTSCRGHKGFKARSGSKRRPSFEGGQTPLARRLPKVGFNHSKRHPFAAVNVDLLENNFDSGAEVTLASVVEAGLAEVAPGGLKVLGRGDLTKKLVVIAHSVSAGARQKIEAAGGSITLIPAPGAESGQEG
ncbi:MAG: 50S ribosomal protein L15 [Candidatus Hydrogenedentota bacterium]